MKEPVEKLVKPKVREYFHVLMDVQLKFSFRETIFHIRQTYYVDKKFVERVWR